MKTFEGNLTAAGMKIAIVASRFNGMIVESLIAGARDAIVRSGGRDDAIAVFRAPGSFEIPQLLRRVVGRGGFDAVVCLGAVIRGATPHFDYVAGAVARGVSQVAAEASIPITFGVLTTDTIEQAVERSGTKAGNKGFDAAMAAIEMVNLYRTMDS
jgi:6,7-dimethyl-8-ribityllumazine synthase